MSLNLLDYSTGSRVPSCFGSLLRERIKFGASRTSILGRKSTGLKVVVY